MEDAIVIPIVVGTLFIGLPWLILHYVTKWKQAKSITIEDEDLLDELHDIARRLDDRMNTIERIIAADKGEAPRVSDLRDQNRPVEFRSYGRNKEI